MTWPAAALDALAAVHVLAALAGLRATAELIAVRDPVVRGGWFGWDMVAPYRPLGRWPMSAGLMSVIFSPAGVNVMIGARLAACSALVTSPWWSNRPMLAACVLILWLTQMALNQLIIPSGASGAHGMLTVVSGALALHQIAGGTEATAALTCWFLTAQCLLSYVVAGLGKLRSRPWRRGTALTAISAHSRFGGRVLRNVMRIPGSARGLSWVVIAAECGAPLCLWLPGKPALVILGLGVTFHALNAGLLGLSSFLWAWLACYPALVWVITS